MADEKYKSVSTFALPDEYQRQASEARRRRRMAEMLAQQAYQPGDIQNAPIPRGAPLVQGLQAYLTARAARKADEAEESAAETQTREAKDLLDTLTRPKEDFNKIMNLGQVAQIGTPELVDGQLKYPDTFMEAPNLKMIPQAGPRVQLGRKPEDDQVYMPTDVSRFTATGRETDPKRMAAMLANPQFQSGFTDEQLLKQRLNLTREAMLTSENPMVQKVAGAIYPTLQPEKTKLQLGNINPADFTTASIADAMKSGDVSKLQPIAKPGKAPDTTSGMMWDAKTNAYVAIPGYEELQGRIAKQRRPDVINTGSEPVVRIKGPDGKTIYATRADAIGKEPAPNPTNAPIMPPGIARDVASLQTKAQQFGAGNERATYFRKLIKNGSLPLDVLSGAKYAAQRATDPKGTSRDSKGGKPAYVLYSELNRFVTEQVNTIMQLAKGTQTEGDAIRAQQQILDNPNNSAVVLSALDDLERTFSNAQKYAKEEAEYLSKPYEAAASNEVQEVDY